MSRITKRFKIEWKDPETGEIHEVVQDFEGDDKIKPEEWAEDFAYARADKGWYSIKEVRK